MKSSKLFVKGLLVLVLILICQSQSEATLYSINNVINGSQEVPPVTTSGNGTIVGTYDDVTNVLSTTITFSSLTGTTSAGHYHGPAMPSTNAGVRIGFTNIPLGVTSGSFSPMHTLSESQETELLSGLWYVNIHTSFRPGGEIRGQIYPQEIKNLDLTFSIEGMYDPNTMMLVRDTVTVNIREATSPFSLVQSRKVFLSATNQGTLAYTGLQNSTPYYIQVLHRNAIETWSATGVEINSGTTAYNFTSSAGQAFGSNMVQVGSIFCAYSGDVNQDGTIDASDLASIDNDANNFVSGYVSTDLDGNDFVDGSDLSICDNNASNFVSVIRP